MNLVKNLYASDFGHLSPGGVRQMIESLSRHVPANIKLTHVGLGPLAGPLPLAIQEYEGLGPTVAHGERAGVNKNFVKRLLHERRRVFEGVDLAIIHRVEHTLCIPPRMKTVLLLHGGSWGMLRSGQRGLGLLYPVAELLAGLRATEVLSVAVEANTNVLRCLCSPRSITTAYDERLFYASESTQVSADPECLVVAARLVPEKRIDIVIRAAKEACIREVHVFGEGPDRLRLERKAKELRVRLVLHGHVAPATLAEWYRRNRAVFVLTSMFEGFPVSAIEAAASGKPVVALESPGTSQAISRIGGHLASEAHELPHAIWRAWRSGNRLCSSEVRRRFSSKAVAENFWAVVNVALEP